MSKSRSRSMGRSLAAAGAACLLFAGATFAHDTVTGATSADPALNQWQTASETWDETDRGEVADANENEDANEVDEFDETDRGEVASADDQDDADEAKDTETEPAAPPKATKTGKADQNDQGEDEQGEKAGEDDQGEDEQGDDAGETEHQTTTPTTRHHHSDSHDGDHEDSHDGGGDSGGGDSGGGDD